MSTTCWCAAWSSLDNLDEATACFGHAIELRPGVASVHYNLGTLLMRRQQLDEAAIHFRHAVRLKPDYSETAQQSGRGIDFAEPIRGRGRFFATGPRIEGRKRRRSCQLGSRLDGP